MIPTSTEYACASCRMPLLTGASLDDDGRCPLCATGATRFDAAHFYGLYDGELRALIHLFKYRRVASLARPLGRMLLRAIPYERRYDAIVPVPLHWRRKFARGFNQSTLLAREISTRMHVPVHDVLRRVRATPSQSGLAAHDRRRNLRGAFEVRNAGPVTGLHVLLVDDVLTTGSTVNACAQELKAAGARFVTVATLARADRRPLFPSLQEPAPSPSHSFSKGAS